MDAQDRTESLLIEIRDLQKAQLAAYEKQAARGIELAEESVRRQRRAIRVYLAAILVFAAFMLWVYWPWLSGPA